jgi:hypothetical protein
MTAAGAAGNNPVRTEGMPCRSSAPLPVRRVDATRIHQGRQGTP